MAYALSVGSLNQLHRRYHEGNRVARGSIPPGGTKAIEPPPLFAGQIQERTDPTFGCENSG